MKKIKALMFAFVLAGMTVVSCSSDDSSGPAPTIEGKWNQVKTTVKVTNGGTSTIPYDSNESGCEKDYLEFLEGGVFNDAVFNKSGGGDCQETKYAGTWTKTDSSLTIANAGTLSGTYTITKLTNSDLQVQRAVEVGGVVSTATIYLSKVN